MTEQSNDVVVEPIATEENMQDQEIKEWTGEPEGTTEDQPAKQPEQVEDAKPNTEPEKAEQKKTHAQERYEQLERENAELKRKYEESQAQSRQSELKRPKVEDFESYSKYEDAIEQYHIDVAEQRIFEKLKQQESEKTVSQKEQEMSSAIAEIEDEGVDFKSYAEKAENLPRLPLTLDSFGLSAKETLLLAKDLLDDEDGYVALSRMNATQAAVKIGQIIESKKQKTPPAVSKAPPPIKPVQANASVSRDSTTMSDDEWYRENTKQRNKGK
ncbi:MAG: hypothetical protein [Bacteriophage sp.]|nr:MAG: hypothetical protein [Bacteriophage sp.]